MRVLLTSHLFPNEVHPISGIFIKEQVKFLRKGCDIKAVVPVPWFQQVGGFGRWSLFSRVPSKRRVDGIDVLHPRYLRFPRMILISSVWISYLLALLRSGKGSDFDIVHAHVVYPDGFAGVVFSKIVHRPVVVTAHGSDVNIYSEKRILRKLIVWALRRSDTVIAVSRGLRDKLVSLGIPSDKIRVIHNGVDLNLFRPMDRDFATAKMGLSKGKKRIIYIGRLDRLKGIGVLIEAMATIASQRKDLELLLVGAKGGDEAEYAAMADRLGLKERVTFVNEVPISEVPLWLAASDVSVLPSFSEGFPLSIVEALACGRPVVSTRCGGPEEIIDGHTGILVRPGDPLALADAIGYVIDHPGKYKPEEIASYAREKFDLEAVASKVLNLYHFLTAGSTERGGMEEDGVQR